MKEITKIIALAFIFLAVGTLQAKEIKGNQQITKESRQVPIFEQLNISSENMSGDMNVNVSYAIQPAVEIQGESNLLEFILTEVKGGTLNVKIPKKTQLSNNIPVTLNITLPLLKKLTYSGSGNVNAAGVMNDKMEFVLSGRGDFNLKNISISTLKMTLSGNFEINCGEIIAPNTVMNLSGSVHGTITNYSASKFELTNSSTGQLIFNGLKAESSASIISSGTGKMEWNSFVGKDLKAVVSGSGETIITGTAKDVNITSSGTGSFDAFALIAKKCKVLSSGSTSIYVAPTDNLEVTLSGTGNLYYKGNAKIKIENSGTGQLINKN